MTELLSSNVRPEAPALDLQKMVEYNTSADTRKP